MRKKQGAWAVIHCPTEDTILLGQRSSHVNNRGLWNHFGGCLDGQESPKQGLERELYEETGLALSNRHIILQEGKALRKLGCVETPDERKRHYFLLLVDKTFTPTLNQEHSHFFWFRREHLPRRINPATQLSAKLQWAVDTAPPWHKPLQGFAYPGNSQHFSN